MKGRLKPYRIVATYAILSALWILFSDNAAVSLFSGTEYLLAVNTLKGWFYVAVISSLLFVMLRRYERQTQDQHRMIQEREERLRLLVENAGDAIYIARLDGSFIEVNSEAERQTGFSKQELLSMSVGDLDNNVTRESFLSFGESMRSRKRMSFETLHRRKDGSTFPVEVKAVYLESGGEECVFGIARDMTERKIAEENLHRSSTMLASILNTVPQSIFWKDVDSVYLGCNMSFARDAGLSSPKDVSGKNDYDMPWLPEESDAFRADDRAVMSSGQPKLHIIEQQYRADGSRRWLDTSKFPMLDQDGNVRGVLGIYEDTTERKLAAEALRASEEKYRRLHESMMDAYLCMDMDGRIREHNNALLSLLGYSGEELLGMTNAELTPPEDQATERRVIEGKVLQRGYSDLYEKRYLKKDGTTLPVELRTYLERDVDGRPAGMWSIARDITERIRLHEAMVQSEKMMSVGGLAAGMAHEINNPLGGILQSAQVLAARLRDDLPANLDHARAVGCDMDSMRAYFEKRGIFDLLSAIRESAARAAKIVGDMLEFSRKSTSGYLPADINAIVDKAVELASKDYDLTKNYDFRAVSLQKEYGSGLPKVRCNSTEIEQVILNLLKNAAQALSGVKDRVAPVITLSTGATEDGVYVVVEDNGPGMEQDVAKRVFEPFFTTKDIGHGTGLGLAVSYFIVSSHHSGRIELETSPGRGAKFTVKLPF